MEARRHYGSRTLERFGATVVVRVVILGEHDTVVTGVNDPTAGRCDRRPGAFAPSCGVDLDRPDRSGVDWLSTHESKLHVERDRIALDFVPGRFWDLPLEACGYRSVFWYACGLGFERLAVE